MSNFENQTPLATSGTPGRSGYFAEVYAGDEGSTAPGTYKAVAYISKGEENWPAIGMMFGGVPNIEAINAITLYMRDEGLKEYSPTKTESKHPDTVAFALNVSNTQENDAEALAENITAKMIIAVEGAKEDYKDSFRGQRAIELNKGGSSLIGSTSRGGTREIG